MHTALFSCPVEFLKLNEKEKEQRKPRTQYVGSLFLPLISQHLRHSECSQSRIAVIFWMMVVREVAGLCHNSGRAECYNETDISD